MYSTHQGLCFSLVHKLADLTLEIQYVVMIVYSGDILPLPEFPEGMPKLC